jgi:hypothetical protein
MNLALTLAAEAARHLPFYWHLPLVIVVISLVYSATRFERWGAILGEAFRWGLRMGGFLVAIAVVLYVLAAVI